MRRRVAMAASPQELAMAAPPQELERSIKGRGQPPARKKPPDAPAPAQSEPESDHCFVRDKDGFRSGDYA